MRSRDLAVVATVLAVGGLAVADAFRGGSADAPSPGAPPTVDEAAATSPEPQSFDPVPARGELLFADASDCRLRSVPVRTGVERPLPGIDTGCELSAPATGPAYAYGLDAASGRLVALRFSDFGEVGRRIGSILAVDGDVHWSSDGRRAAWCRDTRSGFVATTAKIRVVERCPIALTPRGDVAWASGRRLVTAGGTVLETSGRIDAASWGRDGSIGLLVDGRTIERWAHGRRTGSVEFSRLDETPRFSPDNCAVLDEGADRIHVVDLGCFRGGRDVSLLGMGPAAWSPDGRWVVVGRPRITFYRLDGGNVAARASWEAAARAVVWRSP